MEINFVSIKQEDKDTLFNLYQLYEYDFSKYTNQDVNKNGRYALEIDFLWEGDDRWRPYFIKVSEKIVGFLVILFEDMDIDPDPTHVIYDFLILQKYRRMGIGKAAAIKAFGMFNANWKVSQMENNDSAISFWRKVIKGYTGDNFFERYIPERKKYIQEFSTKS